MKRFVLILLLLASPCWAADYYVDQTGGNDSNTGLATDNAWKTLSKIAGYTFSCVDNVYLNRGETWREELLWPGCTAASGSSMTFGAYGTGAKPLIQPTLNKSTTDDWTSYSDNVYYSAAPGLGASVVDVGNVIINGATLFGIKKATSDEVDSLYEFWWDNTNKRVYIYAGGNPASVWTDIELGTRTTRLSALEINGTGQVNIQNIGFKYASSGGIYIRSSQNVTVESCDFNYNGGAYQLGNTTRLGNDVQVESSNDNITVRYCRMNQTYDGAISAQGITGSESMTNYYFYRNVITNAGLSCLEFMQKASSGNVDNVYYENNSCIYDNTANWAVTQRPDLKGLGFSILSAVVAPSVKRIYIRNNLYSGSFNEAAYFITGGTAGWTDNLTMTNNLYDQTGGGDNVIHWLGTEYTPAQFATYQSESGKDANSVYTIPLFKSSTDYHLNWSSPPRNAGVNTGWSPDYEGNGISGAYDIGAYEYWPHLDASLSRLRGILK